MTASEPILRPTPCLHPATSEAPAGRVALVYMPWGAISRASIAMGILQQCARRAGWQAEVHYLNLRFAERIGFEGYDHISRNSELAAEWFFAAHLEAEGLSADPAERWRELAQGSEGRALQRELEELSGSPEVRREIAEVHVPAFLDECLERIDWASYDAVGFSMTFAQSLASLLLARRLRDLDRDKILIFGGANVDGEMGIELLRAYEWMDYVVHGEAERSFPRLLVQLAEDRREVEVPGVSYRHRGRVIANHRSALPETDLDAIPVPDYDDYYGEVRRTGLDRRITIKLPFESSRGCWWGAKSHCTFCGLNRDGLVFRSKTPERALAEILELAGRYRNLSLFAVDNILDMRYFQALLPRLSEADVDLSIFYEVKANLRREQVRGLKAAGVRVIQPGIESFNTDILKRMRKGVTAIQNVQLLKWCLEEGIEVAWNILYGLPDEEPGDYADLPDLLLSLSHLQPPAGLSRVVYERFSPYHFDHASYGLTLTADPYYRLLYRRPGIDHDKLAYYFKDQADHHTADPEVYIDPTRRVVEAWRQRWGRRDRRPTLVYEKGPGFVILYDSRPVAGRAGGGARRTVLSDLQSRAYLFCDESRSFVSILGHLGGGDADGGVEEKSLRRLLDRLVDARLMFREGERYLSLAVRRPAVVLAA